MGLFTTGASWTADSGKRVRIDREKGQLEADVIYLHDNAGNGDFRLKAVNGQIIAYDDADNPTQLT